jgi:hypothetical protein
VTLSIITPITAAAADTDVDIGALICDTSHSREWKVSGDKISRSEDGYARVSGTNTVAGYSARKLGDETVKLRFSCSLDSNDGWIAFMLRSNGPTKALWNAKYTYGLLFRKSQVELQRWRANTCTSLAVVNFSVPEDETFKLRFSACNQNGAVVLTAIINDEEIINFTDTADPIEGSGYFSIMTFNNSYVDIYADSNQPGSSTADPLVYLTGCYEEGGKRFIHWRYNGAYKSFTGVVVSGEDGGVLAELQYPADTYDLPDSYTAGKIFVTPLTENGVQREPVEISTTPQQPKEEAGGRIAVQSADEGAYFYNTKTGEPFIPCGANYIRLRNGDHSTFEAATSAGPADYDPYDAEAALKLMADNGMNTVRVFVIGRSSSNPGIAGSPDTPGVYAPYMDNLADFILRAKRYGIYVILTFGDGELPVNNHYASMLAGLPAGHNTLYLTDQGIKARAAYLCDTLNYLKSKDPALLDGLLAVELQNELALYSGEWPFDDANKSTKVTGADGQVYDMSLDADRQALADNGIRYYINSMTAEIKKIDPKLLVCEGSFTFSSVSTTPEDSFGMHSVAMDTRLPSTAEVLLGTKLDFLDIHIYQGNPAFTPEESFRDQYDSMLLNKLSPESQAARRSKPIIMGEFGSFKNADNSKSKALETMLGLRGAGLDAGMRGMLYWTLDCFEQETLHCLCESPEMLSELAQFDLQLPKVDISALSPAATPVNSYAVPSAAPTGDMADEAGIATDINSGGLPLWVFAAIAGALAAVVCVVIILKKKSKSVKG